MILDTCCFCMSLHVSKHYGFSYKSVHDVRRSQAFSSLCWMLLDLLLSSYLAPFWIPGQATKGYTCKVKKGKCFPVRVIDEIVFPLRLSFFTFNVLKILKNIRQFFERIKNQSVYDVYAVPVLLSKSFSFHGSKAVNLQKHHI